MKRAVDIVGATIALILFGIPMIVIALLIRVLDPGPVFFRQARLGKNGTPFLIFKFRSMKVNAPDVRNEDGSAFTGDNDPRVTKLGRFLRKTSLDELPQLINVLFGHMSLVGPRPDQVDQIGDVLGAQVQHRPAARQKEEIRVRVPVFHSMVHHGRASGRDRADAPFVDQGAGLLMRTAQKGIGRTAQAQPARCRQIAQRQPVRQAQCQGLFRIDMFAGLQDRL